jgi:hypothetical protein
MRTPERWGEYCRMIKTADISPCGTFRWRLTRTWDHSKPVLLFVMLNPSKADASIDDPTVRRCIGFAVRNNYGGIVIVNLFAYRATNPQDLKANGWPQGDGNEQFVRGNALAVHAANGRVVIAWGAHARGRIEATAMLGALRNCGIPLYALKILPGNVPAHPLMLPYTCGLTKMEN